MQEDSRPCSVKPQGYKQRTTGYRELYRTKDSIYSGNKVKEIKIWRRNLQSKRIFKGHFNQMGASLTAQLVKNPPAMQETLVRFLD